MFKNKSVSKYYHWLIEWAGGRNQNLLDTHVFNTPFGSGAALERDCESSTFLSAGSQNGSIMATLTGGRSLLTERDARAGDATDSYRYKTRTYFRRRFLELEKDVELLAEQDEQLLEELRDVVCED